jgi:lipoprotein signal peptidase
MLFDGSCVVSADVFDFTASKTAPIICIICSWFVLNISNIADVIISTGVLSVVVEDDCTPPGAWHVLE